jgi:hypothetical protein
MMQLAAHFEGRGQINFGDWVIHEFRHFYPKTHTIRTYFFITYTHSFEVYYLSYLEKKIKIK